ncbi:hypothetical protein GLOIN_2v1482674 [Rhizophagus clarus]|uniref:Uncharacterized protein n=1 Tax=Rhizophagus clarus TaxID=94130 RepID=A0A8H3L0M9_9GLOM|nr:hypothetical protein GLOIN_2v1482674 [Rhizophagus clarus]
MDINKAAVSDVGKFHILKSQNKDFQASKQTGFGNSVVYKISDKSTISTIDSSTILNEPTTSTIGSSTILNEPTTSEPSISMKNFKEFGTERLVEFLRNNKNLSKLKA